MSPVQSPHMSHSRFLGGRWGEGPLSAETTESCYPTSNELTRLDEPTVWFSRQQLHMLLRAPSDNLILSPPRKGSNNPFFFPFRWSHPTKNCWCGMEILTTPSWASRVCWAWKRSRRRINMVSKLQAESPTITFWVTQSDYICPEAQETLVGVFLKGGRIDVLDRWYGINWVIPIYFNMIKNKVFYILLTFTSRPCSEEVRMRFMVPSCSILSSQQPCKVC